MRVKKYTANTMNDALLQIKEELGSDAVILNSKQIKKGGIFGLFQKTQIEVIAALDEHPIPEEKQPIMHETKQMTHTPPPLPFETKSSDQHQVLEEIKQLRQLVASKTFQGNEEFTGSLNMLYQYLLDQEVNHDLAKMLVRDFEEMLTDPTIIDEQLFKQLLQTELQPLVDQAPLTQRKVIQFVGPTGVGKTTTIAKVAAKMMLEQQKKVAFITTDTYRIAAIEQLKTYAKILDVPLEVVYTNDDYEQALVKFANYDHIFVDTAGRNYREANYVSELQHLIQMAEGDSVTYLVLSLTAKASDNDMIYNIFKDVGIHQVIFTKADETTTYGSMLNLCLGENAKVAYLSNGQNVPDDLVEADAVYMSNMLLSGYDHA